MINPRFKSNGTPREDNTEVTKTSREQRMFSRFRVNFSARFRNLNVGRRRFSTCADIGAGGVSMNTNEELELKTPLEVWIDIADGFDPVNLKGRVAWSKKIDSENCRTGVVFDCPRLIAFSRVMKTLRK